MSENEEDELSDVDQENPVDCSAQTWADIYSRHPELLDHDD